MREFEETFRDFQTALGRLKEALESTGSGLARDAAIKRFEFTFELAWKSVQRFLRAQGTVGRSPKECLREAFSHQLIQDHPLWTRMLDDRNLTAHTYDELTAARVFGNLPDYVPLLEQLVEGLSGAARS